MYAIKKQGLNIFYITGSRPVSCSALPERERNVFLPLSGEARRDVNPSNIFPSPMGEDRTLYEYTSTEEFLERVNSVRRCVWYQ